jgi:TBC1 domain family member 15
MTIELDSTLAQAEVLFLSFAQLVADIDRRRFEEASGTSNVVGLRRRGAAANGNAVEAEVKINMPALSDNLRELLQAGR